MKTRLLLTLNIFAKSVCNNVIKDRTAVKNAQSWKYLSERLFHRSRELQDKPIKFEKKIREHLLILAEKERMNDPKIDEIIAPLQLAVKCQVRRDMTRNI